MSLMSEMKQNHYPGHDLRGSERQVTVLINAGIRCRGIEGLCRIRNISASGMKVETLVPMEIGDVIEMQLRSGREMPGVVKWIHDRESGIAIDGLDVNDVLNDRVSPETMAKNGAFPSFAQSGTIVLSVNHKKVRCSLTHISLADATFTDGPDLAIGSVQDVEIDGLGKALAKVVHRDGETTRVMFTQPLNFRALEAWLGDQRGAGVQPTQN